MPAALDVQWDLIRCEFSHGVSLSQLAEKYGVALGTLKHRSAYEDWMAMRPETHSTKVEPVPTAPEPSVQDTLVQAAKSQGQSLAEAGQAYAARTFHKFSRLVEQANLAPPKNFKDAEIADKIARRSAGLDTADVQVNTVVGVNLAGDDGFYSSPEPVFEVDSVQVPPTESLPIE